jgi:cell wall-associated NlpC family hydrolase
VAEPLPGDYLVTKTGGPWLDRLAAWLIRWGTARRINGGWVDAPINHAAVYVGDGVIVEAVGKVRYGTIDEYPDATWSTGRLPAEPHPSPSQRKLIADAAHDMIGRPYGWLDILAIGLAQKRAGHIVTARTWWAKRLNSGRTLICSEIVEKAYMAAGITLVPGSLPGLVSPEDLDALLLPDATQGATP